MKNHRSRNRYTYLIIALPLAGIVLAGLYLFAFDPNHWLEPNNVGHLKEAVDELSAFRQTVGPEDLRKTDDIISSTDSLAWGSASSLTLIVLLGAVCVTGYVIWKALRGCTHRRRWILLTLCFVTVLLLIDYKRHLLTGQLPMTKQFVGVIQSHFNAGGYFGIRNIEALFLEAGLGAALAILVASGLTLLPLGELIGPGKQKELAPKAAIEEAACYTARQIKHQRALLYVGTLLLVMIAFRQNVTLRWALDYLQPPAQLEKVPAFGLSKFLFQRLEILVSNTVTGTGIMNTLLLAGLYVPAALVLQRRAIALSRLAVKKHKGESSAEKEESEALVTKDQADWMEQHGLAFPLRDQLPKIAAILSPLLAGPMGQLLSFLK